MESTRPPPQMFHGDCFDVMADDDLRSEGSVNLVLCDPPLGVRLANTTMPHRSVLRVLLIAMLSLSVEGIAHRSGRTLFVRPLDGRQGEVLGFWSKW
jgi:tRNA G10  N-methylase Trm11